MRASKPFHRIFVTMLAGVLAFSLRETYAQSLGELARQERARKLARPSRVTKVFTNEDLAKETILGPTEQEISRPSLTGQVSSSPEVREIVVAREPAEEPRPAPSIPARGLDVRPAPVVPEWPAGIPLGDIARYYRQQIAPQIPSVIDSVLLEALAHQPEVLPHETQRLSIILAPAARVVAAAEETIASPETGIAPPEIHVAATVSELPMIPTQASADVPAFDAGEAPPLTAEVETVRSVKTAAASLPSVAPAVRSVLPLAAAAIAAPERPSETPFAVIPAAFIESRQTAAPVVIARTAPAAESNSAVSGEAAEGVSPYREIQVQRGDSLWKLALRHFGDGRAWPRIAAVNSQLQNPHRVRAGQTLRLPHQIPPALPNPFTEEVTPATDAAELLASTNPARQLLVQKGDSLWKLAQSELGRGAAWSCIAEANPQVTDSSRIFPGQTLALPGNCASKA